MNPVTTARRAFATRCDDFGSHAAMFALRCVFEAYVNACVCVWVCGCAVCIPCPDACPPTPPPLSSAGKAQGWLFRRNRRGFTVPELALLRPSTWARACTESVRRRG